MMYIQPTMRSDVRVIADERQRYFNSGKSKKNKNSRLRHVRFADDVEGAARFDKLVINK
jgi:hypothetical protein